jgi:hypothetical protein
MMVLKKRLSEKNMCFLEMIFANPENTGISEKPD